MGTFKFGLTAGALVRGGIRRQLRTYCFVNEYTLDIKEEKSLLDSQLLVTITAPDEKINQVSKDVLTWVKRANDV